MPMTERWGGRGEATAASGGVSPRPRDGAILVIVVVVMIGIDAIRYFSTLGILADSEVEDRTIVCQTRESYLITRDVWVVSVWAI